MHFNIDDHVRRILETEKGRKDKIKMLNELRKWLPPEQNRWHLRSAMWVLGLLVLSIPVVAGISIYRGQGFAIPDGVLSLGSAAAGALTTYLVPFSQQNRENDKRNDKQEEAIARQEAQTSDAA